MCTTLTFFIYRKLRVSVKEWKNANPNKAKKYQEFIKILVLISLKKSLYNAIRLGISPCLWQYTYSKYIGHVQEDGRGSFSELVSVLQYRSMNRPKINDNDRAHQNDVNTLFWHMANASFQTSAS